MRVVDPALKEEPWQRKIVGPIDRNEIKKIYMYEKCLQTFFQSVCGLVCSESFTKKKCFKNHERKNACERCHFVPVSTVSL